MGNRGKLLIKSAGQLVATPISENVATYLEGKPDATTTDQ